MDASLNLSHRLGLEMARAWNFSDQQFEEATRRKDSLLNANNLLGALLDVKSSNDISVNVNKTSASSLTTLTTTTTTASGTVEPTATNLKSGDLIDMSDRDSCSCSCSSNSSSVYSVNQSLESLQLRPKKRVICVDGSNVAFTHGKDVKYSWKGIRICVDWFTSRKHECKVLVPKNKCHLADRDTLEHLRDAIIETPNGFNDDMFIIEAARNENGVIVSNDEFRHETKHSEELRNYVRSNRLPYIFFGDSFITVAKERGPNLEQFLMATPMTEMRAGSLVKPKKSHNFNNRRSLQLHHNHNHHQLNHQSASTSTSTSTSSSHQLINLGSSCDNNKPSSSTSCRSFYRPNQQIDQTQSNTGGEQQLINMNSIIINNINADKQSCQMDTLISFAGAVATAAPEVKPFSVRKAIYRPKQHKNNK